MTKAPIMAALTLLLGACASTPQPIQREFGATLTSFQQVPGPGDARGTGTATVRISGDRTVCYELNVRGIAAMSAQLHQGPAGTAGSAVLELARPDATGRSAGCGDVAEWVMRELIRQPHDFYIDAHTADLPNGAIRGQLRSRLAPLPRSQQRQPIGFSGSASPPR